ncbi:MAG: putative FKBP-type peptidyl-prolyl cis-trans isomerase [Chlamydiae bacterium]|nr:putative FKBP-type peptidyl-prolyl cis-trans isomerase [Chlamydiota bacterium]
MIKRLLFLISFVALGICEEVAIEDAQPAAEKKEELDMATLSKAFGHHIGKNLASPEFANLNLDAVLQGIKEEAEGTDSPLSEMDYTKAMTKIEEQHFIQTSKKNLEKVVSFLAENAKDKKVTEIEAGKLQYKIETQGKGEMVQEHSTPLIHYVGKYLNGREFSSSRDGDPIALAIDEAITGLARGILGMKEGETRTLFIHPDLGYGSSGDLNSSTELNINSLLIFEVEVIRADTPPEIGSSNTTFSEEEHHKISMQ